MTINNKHAAPESLQYCIVGGGLVGALLAVVLAKKGYKTDVLERREDIRKNQAEGGRSINLALSYRGLKALEMIGLADEVKKMCIPMYGRAVHGLDGEVRIMQYGINGEAINSISRDGLNRMLLEEADKSEGINLYFNEKCEHISLHKNEITLKNELNRKMTKKHYDVFFGTDGAFSASRLSLMKTDGLDFGYQQSYLDHGYKELHIPPANHGGWLLEKNALHIWPRKSFMMIALPNMDGSFTCTLFLAQKGEVSFENLNTDEEVMRFFKQYFPDLIILMPDLLSHFNSNPTASLATIKCNPWAYQDKMTLLGDAAHAMVPFYGQGMNCGFEDCSEMESLIDRYSGDWKTIFEVFGTNRKPNSDAISDMAIRNFVEMRDLVADPEFILKNAIDKAIGKLFPDKWIPMYTMVSFTDTAYSDAKRQGEAHDRILDDIVRNEGPEIGGKLADKDIVSVLRRYLN